MTKRQHAQFPKLLATFLFAGLLSITHSNAQDPLADLIAIPSDAVQSAQPASVPVANVSTATDSAPKKRWLMLSCGLPGDDERLTAACRKIMAAAKPILGVAPENLRVLAGDEEMQTALAASGKQVGICTKDSITETIHQLGKDVGESDSCWVILLGHAHLYGNSSQYNILDSDIDQIDFATAAKSISCREQVFWITMPVSGFWIKPLSRRSRVIITATEADLEITGTEMPYTLADLLGGESDEPLGDTDNDGKISLLDLYLATNLQIHDLFKSMDRLQTEHAHLEDNGDGRGSEVQMAYLPIADDESDEDAPDVEPGPDVEPEDAEEDSETESSSNLTRPMPQPISNSSLDGFRSRQIQIIAPK